MSDYVYKADNITLLRHKRLVLDDLSINVKAGEMTGLVGPNSAGKSSLLEVLLGFLIADSGAVTLKHKLLGHWTAQELARTVAYMPQQTFAHWPISVYDYVALGRIPYLRFGQKISVEDRSSIENAIEKLDLEDLRLRPVTELSGGELSRVSLARVLSVEAEVILVDEPIAGLDPGHQLSIMQILQQEAVGGKAVVIVIHDLALASRYCDSLWLMNKGRMICSGQAREVLTDKNLREVYKVSAKVIEHNPREIVMPWSLIEKDSGLKDIVDD